MGTYFRSFARFAPAVINNVESLTDEYSEVVLAAIPPALVNMSKSNLEMLKKITPSTPDWLKSASPQQRAEARRAIEESVAAHTAFSALMDQVKSPEAFAEPLLRAKLKDETGFDIELQNFWLAFSPSSIPSSHPPTERYTFLQAALHNFDEEETDFRSFSRIGWEAYQPTDMRISALRFIELCRELDVGQLYQAHIRQALKLDDATGLKTLSDAFTAYQSASLKASSHVAVLKGDIEARHHRALLEVADGKKDVKVDGKSLWYRGISFMNMPLEGCAIFEIADPEDDSVLDKLLPTVDGFWPNDLIVWIPDDPDHPLKLYPKLTALKSQLVSQFVRKPQDEEADPQAPTDYQVFFSRFVKHKDRPKFFSSFTELVTANGPKIRRQKKEPDFLLQELIVSPSGDRWDTSLDIWQVSFRRFRHRLLADARSAAVPTADADARGRRAWLSQLLDIGLMALNLVSFVVPAVGVLMLGVTAIQLMDDVLEGIEDLSLGDRENGWQLIHGVLVNLAIMGAGAALIGKLASGGRTEFLPIELENGQKRLWKPDLAAYRSKVSLADVEPNAREQFLVANKLYVRVEGHVYEKRFDPVTNAWRIVHPRNPNAYQPLLSESANGWNHGPHRPVPALSPELPPVAPVDGHVLTGEGASLDVAPAHPPAVSGIDNRVNARYAVEESLILGLQPAKGVYRSVDGQWCYIRNIDDAGVVSVYRIRDSFNLNAEIMDVNIVDPQSNRATELRLREVAPDQWQPLSLRGGARPDNLLAKIAAFERKQLPNGLWEPKILVVSLSDTRYLPSDWGPMHELPFSIEPTSIHQALEMSELGRLPVATDLMEGPTGKLSPGIASQLDMREGGGSFLFTMQRMKYSGAVEGEFNALKVIDLEAGERPEGTNAISAYWSPQGGYVDVPIHPGWGQPDHVFTPGFSGCSLVVEQMDENLLRVRHVEASHEAAQYVDLAPQEHGWGLSAAMELPDYGLRLDQNGNPDSILTGFAFMKYDRTARVWKLHYQSNQGATAIAHYSKEQPGWFSRPDTLVRVFGRTKVLKINTRPVTTIERSVAPAGL
ncbi:dermonecrotic toxin domain-containing protein [Pseudomonas sp. GW456-12-1-14-TSB6]|uniref:dermonecrotic toxin domain-containing protein n=1 Tax=unclassified Pseudomonas TaxID=196821 RepID=UPI000CD2A323|nr:DUF6543 domain-containing protein [Pseudomonas sp. GW456-12-1-14-TSB6]POA34213.1 hypothetical protein C1891_19740 [Pseudomonas sp. GW456-12-1-14-TSB6]